MVEEHKAKSVKFFQIGFSSRGSIDLPTEFDWTPILSNLRNRHGKNRLIEESWYTTNGDQSSFGMHKILSDEFLSRVSENDGTIEDHVRDVDADQQLAKSTAVIVFPGTRYFAVVFGQMHAPHQSRVASLATAATPLDPGAHWIVKPVIDESRLKKLKSAKGVTQFSSKFPTQRDLLDPDPEIFGPGAASDRMAESLGGDLVMNVDMELTGYASQQQNVVEKFKKTILKDFRHLVGPKSDAKATIISDDGKREIINLVESDLAMDLEISLSSQTPRFTDLMTLLEANRDTLFEQLTKAADT